MLKITASPLQNVQELLVVFRLVRARPIKEQNNTSVSRCRPEHLLPLAAHVDVDPLSLRHVHIRLATDNHALFDWRRHAWVCRLALALLSGGRAGAGGAFAAVGLSLTCQLEISIYVWWQGRGCSLT